jgi:hypothetical protein
MRKTLGGSAHLAFAPGWRRGPLVVVLLGAWGRMFGSSATYWWLSGHLHPVNICQWSMPRPPDWGIYTPSPTMGGHTLSHCLVSSPLP